jgi:hypothetical protein
MADRPLLALPRPSKEQPRTRPPPRESVPGISAGRQAQRLGPKFERLSRTLPDPAQLAELRQDPTAIVPERALVFEIAGNLTDFYRAVRGVPGFEFLGEAEDEIAADDDFVVTDKGTAKPDKKVPVRFYFTLPDATALNELVSLWNRFQRSEPLGLGRAEWKKVFEHLTDIRPWGPQDRLTEEALDDWRERLADAADQPVQFEIELWFRDNPERRAIAERSFAAELTRLGGRLLSRAEIGEIRYHAALVEVQAPLISDLLAHPEAGLATFDDIMVLRPQSLVGVPIEETTQEADAGGPEPAAVPEGEPIAALFDGLPMAQHARLAGRLTIDDPDDLAAQYSVALDQIHGTAMASLILHGDLNSPTPLPPYAQRLYVRPVMVPAPNPFGVRYERMPPGQLGIDLMWRAFRRMLEGDGGEPPSAPTVRVVNLSLGDAKRRFAGVMSPWARLVDHFAWSHGLVIFVSAGNVTDPVPMNNSATWAEIENADAEERRAVVMRAILQYRADRRLLSPSEAINAVTVGASHGDHVAPNGNPAMAVDPYDLPSLPNPSSALGLGFRRSVKPDFLMPGGRELIRSNSTHAPIDIRPVSQPGRFSGVKVASPGTAGQHDRTTNMIGTSVATALATHSALRVLAALEELPEDPGYPTIDPAFLGVILKAVLAHGARWESSCVTTLQGLVNSGGKLHWEHEREELARFLGYGSVEIDRVLDCTERRATLLGWGRIRAGEVDRYQVPLPPGLNGIHGFRAVSATLGWLTPVNLSHRMYRMAKLDVAPGADKLFSLGVGGSKEQPPPNANARGTLLHRRWEGTKAAPFVDNGNLVVDVGCTSPTGLLDDAIPYGMAISLEVGPDVNVAVYDEVLVQLRQAVAVPVR